MTPEQIACMVSDNNAMSKQLFMIDSLCNDHNTPPIGNSMQRVAYQLKEYKTEIDGLKRLLEIKENSKL